MTRKITIFVFLLSLGFEVLLIVSTAADLRPRRSATVEALFAYQNHPGKETHDRRAQELDKMNRELRTKRIIGYSSLVGNGLISLYLGARVIKAHRSGS
jgi:hypothetical protein